MSVEPAALRIRELRVVFDGFAAVDGVDLDVPAGDVRFLIGPNGAGKTTLVDAVTGLVGASGSVIFGERELLGRKVHDIARIGIGRCLQTATVFEELTVLQNLDIAAGAGRGALALFRRRKQVPSSVAEALETIGLTGHRDQLAGTLAHGQKRWLEIGMLLVQDVKLLLLDEPVAGMSQEERDSPPVWWPAAAGRHRPSVDHQAETPSAGRQEGLSLRESAAGTVRTGWSISSTELRSPY